MRSTGGKALVRFGATICLVVSLAACGGGGGGGGVSSTPTPPSTPGTPTTPSSPYTVATTPNTSTNFNTAEYQASKGSVAMDAIKAYQAGASGAGITAAIIDSGIKTDSPEFSGRILSASQDVVSNRGITDPSGHGTEVSAILAGARNGSGVMGVAYNANLLVLRTDDPGSCATSCAHYDTDIATAINTAVANNARVINISLGGNAPGSVFINAVTAAANAGVIVVISAGNDSNPNPDDFALVANNAGVQKQAVLRDGTTANVGMVIIAGSHDQDGVTLSHFSNAAGTGQNHYLAALGDSVQTINQNGQAVLGSGTSFATPQIAGAAALLAQAFPNLTGAQIVQLLFDSAVDLGATGTDAVYGRGKLSLTRAFSPQGQTSLSSSSASVSLTSNGSLGAPMGDAGLSANALGGAIILDGYSRAFALDIQRTLSRTPVNRSLASRLSGFAQGFSGGSGQVMVSVTVDRRTDASQPWIGLAQANLSAADARAARATAGFIASRIAPGTDIAFGFSQGGVGIADQLSGQVTPAFLIARDPLSTPGFENRPGDAMAIRHMVGRMGVTMTMERGDVVSWSLRQRDRSPYGIGTIRLDRAFGPLRLELGLGVMQEKDSLLGSRLGPVFGIAGSTTRLADAGASLKLFEGWSLSATARQGWTSADVGGGLVNRVNIVTRGFAIDLAGSGVLAANDRFGLRVAQPLRVEKGSLGLAVPVAYDYATGQSSIEARRMSLTPSGRELDVEASYGIPMLGGWVDANAYWRRDPGHIAAARNETGAALRWRASF